MVPAERPRAVLVSATHQITATMIFLYLCLWLYLCLYLYLLLWLYHSQPNIKLLTAWYSSIRPCICICISFCIFIFICICNVLTVCNTAQPHLCWYAFSKQSCKSNPLIQAGDILFKLSLAHPEINLYWHTKRLICTTCTFNIHCMVLLTYNSLTHVASLKIQSTQCMHCVTPALV